MMADINSFFDLVAEQLLDELVALDPAVLEIKHWVVVEDSVGVAVSIVGDEPQAHEILAALIDGGAKGAAYVTYNPEADIVVANVLVAALRNSDIRRANVEGTGRTISLGPWEYTV
jgi:hypothetical protein